MRAAEHRAAVAAAMTEAQLLDGILGTPRAPGLALALGWRGYHTHRSQHSPAGFPDLVLVRRGRLVFAELKRQADRYQPTPAQAAWLEDLREVEDAARDHALGRSVTIDRDPRPDLPPVVSVHLWRPLDLLDGTVEAALR